MHSGWRPLSFLRKQTANQRPAGYHNSEWGRSQSEPFSRRDLAWNGYDHCDRLMVEKVDFLLNNAADTVDVRAHQWRQIYDRADTSIVHLLEVRSGNKVVRISEASDPPLNWKGDANSGVRRLVWVSLPHSGMGRHLLMNLDRMCRTDLYLSTKFCSPMYFKLWASNSCSTPE